MSVTGNRRERGFTLVEVLVAMGIIAVLMGLLLPAISSIRASARETKSRSNLRQWGIGTVNYVALHKQMLPWEGKKDAADMPVNFADSEWWANAIPPLVGERPYREISETATANGTTVPLPPFDSSIFIDPSAHTPAEAPYDGGGKQFFFCYVPSLQLNNSPEWQAGAGSKVRLSMAHISKADKTVLMAEIRTRKEELRADDPFYGFTLARARTDWKRCAARHRDGCHLQFADGHVDHFNFKDLTTNNLGTRNPEEPGADWNSDRVIWNPLGPALED